MLVNLDISITNNLTNKQTTNKQKMQHQAAQNSFIRRQDTFKLSQLCVDLRSNLMLRAWYKHNKQLNKLTNNKQTNNLQHQAAQNSFITRLDTFKLSQHCVELRSNLML